MPDIIEMASNLGKQIVDTTVTLAVSGQVFADEKIQNERFAICTNCIHFISTQSRCNICGCFMKTKVKIIAAKCPAGIW